MKRCRKMLESFNTKSEMQYQRLTEEEKQRRGILGRLVGIIADFKNPTRNGRRYTEELWDKTFDDPVVKEKIDNRCILGELGHPADRQETDIEKVAICLAEMPKKGNDGKLHGVFDILDTPCGRILKTLCDYGCNVGVSSRGGGDTYEDYDGNETVDSNTYEFECFDAVLLPAVKAARPAYVTESFDTHKKTLKVALLEEMSKSSENDQRVMKQTLEELSIDCSEDETAETVTEEKVDTTTPEKVDDIEVTPSEVPASDAGDALVAELQESLQRQQELENQVRELQEKLSVCYTKESRYSDRLGKANSKVSAQEIENKQLLEQIENLRKTNSELSSKVDSLTESLNASNDTISKLNEGLEGYRSRFSKMKKDLNESMTKKSNLDESLKSSETKLKKLTEQYNALKERSATELHDAKVLNEELKNKNSTIVEELQELKKDIQITKSQQSSKLDDARRLVEKYKAIAKTAVDKYMYSQATKIGVSVSDIKSRLNESYSFKDIDKAVEDLQSYKIALNSLPFTTMSDKKRPVSMRIRESKEPLLDLRDNSPSLDDDIDETLLTFTN